MTWLPLATRNLWRQRRRLGLSAVAVVVGLMALVFQRAVINGSQRMAVETSVLGRLGAVQVHRKGYVQNVLAPPLSLAFEDTPGLRASLRSLPHVTAVAPRLELGALVSTADGDLGPGRAEPVLLVAVDREVEPAVTPLRPGLHNERPAAGEVVLDEALATALGQGGGLALLANDRDGLLNGAPVALSGALPAPAPGALHSGLVALPTAQALLRMDGLATEYALAVEPLDSAGTVRDAARALLGDRYEVHTWSELEPGLLALGAARERAFALTFSILLLVVAMGLVNAVLISVLERTREVGTMLALGMRRSQVVRLLVLESALLGLLGGAVGVLLGAGAVLFANHQGLDLVPPGGALPSVVRPFVGAGFCLAALALTPVACALATLYPAVRASRLRPVEALQQP